MNEVKTKISGSGRIVIPAAYRKELDIKPGDDIVMTLEEGEIRLVTSRQAIRRAQQLVRRHVPEGRNLSDELIEERREEAGRA